MQIESLDGEALRRMIRAATAWLGQNKEAVNALNVFPVPDGDTGTNMYLTLVAALREVEKVKGNSVARVAEAAAQGSLMGARGNSGVIVSQFFRGFAQGVNGRDRLSAGELAKACQAAVQRAYRAVMKPTEGTILTVAREGAKAAWETYRQGGGILDICRAGLAQARRTLAMTPQMLPVLREARVVDAGGKGLVIGIEAAIRALEDPSLAWGQAPALSAEEEEPEAIAVGARRLSAESTQESLRFRYCTEFLLRGENLSVDEIKEGLLAEGDSLLVVGDPMVVRVHIHTNHPGRVLEFCGERGELLEIKINNMAEQNRELTQGEGSGGAEQGKNRPAASEDPSSVGASLGSQTPVFSLPSVQPLEKKTAAVAVVAGDGLKDIFCSLGATSTVAGGQTMNPSTEELLAAVEACPSAQVIILPNNSNVILTARQVTELTSKKVYVVPTKTVPQGIAALLVFNPEKDAVENVAAMERAFSQVKTGEVTYAVRNSRINGVEIQEMDIIGLYDGEIKAVGKSPEEVALALVDQMVDEGTEVITVYYGQEVEESRGRSLAEEIRARHGGHEVEVHYGGQPLYYYLLSVE
ncbi:MAG: DAK2 domain-containing protein [Bacillota bacterium]|nr:DAK2 domain-containing protein [Bacillota bacterium]